MKKKTVNAFTLVEMLIVIVIIGILIAALLPRMQAAQGRARDVSRKTALSQIQAAIVTSQGDKGRWPGMGKTNVTVLDDQGKPVLNEDGTPKTEEKEDKAKEGMNVSELSQLLLSAGMTSIPKDPLATNVVKGVSTTPGAAGEYRYIVVQRNKTPDAGFVLMAKTEVDGGSNRVVCENEQGEVNDSTNGLITNSTDITDSSQFKLCSSVEKATGSQDCATANDEGVCYYKLESQLRYIITY